MGETDMKALPISEYQKRFFIEWAMRPEQDAYNVFGVYQIRGSLDTDIFKRACKLFVQQHEEVHARYSQDGGECHWSDYGIDDFYRYFAVGSDEAAVQHLEEVLRSPFDLVRRPLLRLHLISYGVEDEFYFAHVAHHIICDGEMLKIIGEEIAGNYNSFIAGSGRDIADANLLFREAVDAEYRLLITQRTSEARRFWLDLIGDTPLHVRLPFKAHADPSSIGNSLEERAGKSVFFGLSSEQTERLRAYAEARGTTLFVCLAAMYALVLSKYCNQQRFLINYPVNVRPPEFPRAGGSFVNNIPMKMEVDQYSELDDWIEALKAQRTSAKVHQHYSFSQMVRDQAKDNHADIDNCLNVGFASTNLRARNALRLDGLETKTVDVPRRSAIYNLSLLYDSHDVEGIRFRLDCMATLFEGKFAEDLIGSFRGLISDAVDRGDRIDLKKYCVLNDSAHAVVFDLVNPDKREYETGTPIHVLFDRQARRTPEAIAIIDGRNREYTYDDLRFDVDRLARRLIASEGALIGILSEKGYDHVVSTLAVMRSGHGYLPLNVDWPAARIADVLDCGGVRTLLVSGQQRSLVQSDPDCYARFDIIELESSLEASKSSPEGTAAAFPAVSGGDIAYVIFTSGSTGKPKGVTISHSGALNTIHAVNERFSVCASDRVLALSDLSFDLSVYDLFGPIIVGGTAVFPLQSEIRNCEYLAALIRRYGVSLWNSVPQLADLMMNTTSLRAGELDSLRLMLLSGDWIPVGLPADIRRCCATETLEIVSLGGATEGSIWSVWYPIHEVDQGWTSIPYGRAMPNQSMYILDANDVILPIGTMGEICIGGSGVALNYWNDEKKTNSSFFEHETLGRLYRTGDCGRTTREGHIEYGGRNDSQVKIRGYRLELGEIEVHLTSYPGIRQSVVLARSHPGSRNKYLVAYYVSDRMLGEAALIAHLSDRLPDYMIPGMFVHLTELPLTSNGKLDREGLPSRTFVGTGYEHELPGNGTEKILMRLFSAVLSVDPVDISIHADFFRRGGDSISAVRLVGKINSEFPRSNIKVIDVFKYKTVRKLSEYIGKESDERHSIVKSMNDSLSDRLLFMIHPATGGCEVYFGLAEFLVGQYKCYGIDNRNLHHDEQVSDIHTLAGIYLSLMKSVRREMHVRDDAEYTMTGWSLGGQIAFAIAAILESEGVTDIRIISLDAILNDGDEALQKIRCDIDLNRDAFRKGLEARRLESSAYENNDYIEKILNMIHTEKTLSVAPIGRELMCTKILLFKTTEPYLNIDINPNAAELSDHVSRLPCNNVQNIVRDPRKIRVSRIDCDHGTLLREWECIAKTIRQTDWPEDVEKDLSSMP
jgi:amino acid adenylation domain-containing protein